MEWKFERVEAKFEVLPVGKYRLRIKDAEKAISNTSGNDMLVINFEVSGSKQTLRHYIPFLAEKPEVTNRMLTQFFDSFGIDGDFNLSGWVGKCGGCQTKIEQYNGEDKARINYFLSKRQQEDLPAWQDAGGGAVDGKFEEVSPEELPF
jgi:hypothetical protein